MEKQFYRQGLERPLDTVDFIRVIRECRFNELAKENGGTPIYDFHVLFNGEHRLTIQKVSFGQGYEVHDTDHRPIIESASEHLSPQPYRIPRKADFNATVRVLLDRGRVPTLEQIGRRRAAEAEEAAFQIMAIDARRYTDTVTAHAHELLRALVNLYERRTLTAFIEADKAIKSATTPKPVYEGFYDVPHHRSTAYVQTSFKVEYPSND